MLQQVMEHIEFPFLYYTRFSMLLVVCCEDYVNDTSSLDFMWRLVSGSLDTGSVVAWLATGIYLEQGMIAHFVRRS